MRILAMYAQLTAFGAVAIVSAWAGEPSADYQSEISRWRAEREAQLKADDGWLTVVGLSWLKEGANRVGCNPGFEVPLPMPAPEHTGILTVKDGRVRFVPAPNAAVMLNGNPFRQETELKPDSEPHYDVLSVGAVKFHIIKREDKLAVRVKDNNSVARNQFTGLRWYPVDPSWKIQAQYLPWDKPHPVTFDTAVGVKERDESPGYVTFRRKGKEYRMEPVVDGDQLWFVMRDRTSGKTTYSASRFLYADLPAGGLKQSGVVDLDFNTAQNPPCVFTEFATCPLPPAENRLPLAVTAGELMYGNHR